MAISPFRRRILFLVALGVALPAVMLSGLAVYLTSRIARSIENDTARYNTYLAQQVAESFELELMDHLRRAVASAEQVAREGGAPGAIVRALAADGGEFAGPHFVPTADLSGYSLLIVEGQPLLYALGDGRHRNQYFCGLLLRSPDGNVTGAGGWWVDPVRFVGGHLEVVVRERLPGNPRAYGGIELIKRTSIEIFDGRGARIGRVREPGDARAASTEAMAGPFEKLTVRVSVTSDSPIVWTMRFLKLELAFALVMGLAIVVATLFGYVYTVRQIELATLKAGFVSNVTHELKTPIALIRLAIDTLEMKRFRSPEEEGKFLAIIGRETQRLTQLVDNILDFARLEAGRGVFRYDAVDLAPLVRDAVESLKPRLDHLGFQVAMDVPESLPAVQADATTLTHCVLNLLDNAIKYSKVHKELRIAADVRGREVAVSVADRGIGIAPGDRKRIFEKFVRLENGLVHEVRGAGLGLSLVDQIMRAHHGRIEVSSTPGEGSTFTLVLPMMAAVPAGTAEPQSRTGT